MKLLPSRRLLCTIQPCTMSCHFIQSHIHRMHAQLAVTCHQHFWLNDKDLLCCTDFVQEFHHRIFYVVLTVKTFHHMMFYVVLTLCRNFTAWRVMLSWLCAGISPHDLLCCTDYGDISPHDVLRWTDFVQEFHHMICYIVLTLCRNFTTAASSTVCCPFCS